MRDKAKAHRTIRFFIDHGEAVFGTMFGFMFFATIMVCVCVCVFV